MKMLPHILCTMHEHISISNIISNISYYKKITLIVLYKLRIFSKLRIDVLKPKHLNSVSHRIKEYYVSAAKSIPIRNHSKDVYVFKFEMNFRKVYKIELVSCPKPHLLVVLLFLATISISGHMDAWPHQIER